MNNQKNFIISSELIKRYNRPGPRYTSYPTVPVWEEGYFANDFSESLKREGENNRNISLYIHIPFTVALLVSLIIHILVVFLYW